MGASLKENAAAFASGRSLGRRPRTPFIISLRLDELWVGCAVPMLLAPAAVPLEADRSALSGVCGGLTRHVLEEVREVITHTMVDHGLSAPQISLVLVGQHPAAISYAQSTVAAARAAGVSLRVHKLPEVAQHDAVLASIDQLNADQACHGENLQTREHTCARRAVDRARTWVPRARTRASARSSRLPPALPAPPAALSSARSARAPPP